MKAMSAQETTLIFIKPEAVKRGLVGEILSRFERRGIVIKHLQMHLITEDEATAHYAHHRDKPFFGELLEAITAGPVVFAVLQGPRVISIVRKMVGATDPAEALPGTIRGDFGLVLSDNVIHASDSPKTAQEEIARFFPEL
jgi:nucleoside-diphosphate kinase